MRKNLTDNERLIIIEEYLRSDLTKYAICKKHGIDLGAIRRWMSKFGLEDKPQAKLTMKKNRTPSAPESEEIQRLKSENRQLKARLKQEELGHKAYKMLVEMAEETYDIEIRKNFNAK